MGALAAMGIFIIDVEPTAPKPAPFDDTVSMGLAPDDEYGLEEGVELPKAQVFYSQYEYVVGYYGVERFVETQRQEAHTQRFGYPQTVYVTDYSSVDLELAEEGHPIPNTTPSWVDGEDAWYVHGSDARTPSGETPIPFSERDDATTFADTHGGTVLTWDELLEERFETDDASVVRDRVDGQHQEADEHVESARSLRERPVSTVVGDDTETIQEAIEQAPANTTVVVPEGEYEEKLEIDRPVTLRGDGDVTVRGDGTGSVITTTAERTAVVGLTVTGSGSQGSQRDGDAELPGTENETGEWDERFERNYAGGDAGIAVHTANQSLIEDVTVDSSVTGILLRRSGESVVRNVTVHSPADWEDGHAGILMFRTPGVVEQTTVYDGRDAVYSHNSHGIVVRDNELEGNRLGIHLMHTSDALLGNNQLREQSNTGIFVMTGPERNAIVDNDIRDTEQALSPGGSDSYVAGNVLADSEIGLRVSATNSIYERNVIAGNEIGADINQLLPTNQVLENDFVENERHATASSGPLRVWTVNGTGNYWQGAVGSDDGRTIDRSYSPTDPVDQRLHRVDGTPTLAQAPALEALAGLEGSVPGMRTGSIVDLAPTCDPNNPDLLEQTEWEDQTWSCDTPAY
ncbi:NosD domain-containing protein [Natronococcus sp. A-GB7]|uniref:NosD domain-containing protein n=1 Tax=Natronococcus sp. A-GB7 TaxID=3037649 RepID=UPI00241DF931|nr:NosD domain-containing protein [Natronococcus sp. A-GB7]MDG5821122.1 right-handed parallel beta-helix repeat-containing protein [Natronococcus sp. A-GB7]